MFLEACQVEEEILKNLLQLCTKETPFKTPEGALYKHIEEVALGSPLGLTFANFYMGYLENTIFEQKQHKTYTICKIRRYNLSRITEAMEGRSVLKFTYKLSLKNKLPFLGVLLNNKSHLIKTTVYRKKTSNNNA